MNLAAWIVTFAMTAALPADLSSVSESASQEGASQEEEKVSPDSAVMADPELPAQPGSVSKDTHAGVYCGVYSFYAALAAHSRSANLADLLDVRYVSSPLGSTLSDLKRAGDDYAMHTLAMEGMTAGMLRDCRHPVMLHVRTARRGSPYQHWILYLGTEDGGEARIVDPPHGPELVPFADILARWDGIGMIVADVPISAPATMRLGWLEQANHALAALSVVIVLAVVGRSARVQNFRRHTSGQGLLSGILALVAATLVLSVGFHVWSPDGFWRNPNAVASVLTSHHASNLPEISLAELEKLIADGSGVVIDARFADNYERGRIPGAISLPITATSQERARTIQSIPPGAKIVIYCQTSACGFSDEIGSDLTFRGYKNIAIYRGGFKEWKTHAAAKRAERDEPN